MPSGARLAKLGQLFVRAGVLDAPRVATIVAHAEQHGTSFGRAVVELGLTSEQSFVEALAKVSNLPVADLQAATPSAQVLALLDAPTCEQHSVVPVGTSDAGRTLQLAVADPTDLQVVDALARKTGCRVKQLVAGEEAILAAIRRWYYGDTGAPEEFKLLNSGNKTLHPQRGGEAAVQPAPAPGPAHPPTADAELQALRAALESQEKMLRALVDALVNKQLLTAEDLLRARRAAQGK